MEWRIVVEKDSALEWCARTMRGLSLGMLIGLAVAPAVPARAEGVPMVTSGGFSVDQGGSANYNLPIEVVPGIGGIQPSLSLRYSSQSENGLLGVGWSLDGLPTVTRCAQTVPQDGARGFVRYDAEDRFCLDGKRLMLSSGTYGADTATYRTELDSIARITSYTESGVTGVAYFKVETKAGQVLEFGRLVSLPGGGDTNARVMAPVDTDPSAGVAYTMVKEWALTRISDLSGNYLTIRYITDAATREFRPDRIDYTGNTNAGTSPFASVQFFYDVSPVPARTDSVVTYERGLKTEIKRRLTNIRAYNGTTLVTDYQLSYEQSPATKASRIASIKRCGVSGFVTTCLPALNAIWSGSAPSSMTFAQNLSGLTGVGPSFEFFAMGDVTGDGLPDIVNMNPTTGHTEVYRNTSPAVGTFSFAAADITELGDEGHPGLLKERSFQLADFNGDLKDDILLYDPNVTATVGKLHVAISKGDGKFNQFVSTYFKPAPTLIFFPDTPLPGNNYTEIQERPYHLDLNDYNNDGKLDISIVIPGDCRVNNAYPTAFIGHSWLALGKGDGRFEEPTDVNFSLCQNGSALFGSSGNYRIWLNLIDNILFSDYDDDGDIDRIPFYHSPQYVRLYGPGSEADASLYCGVSKQYVEDGGLNSRERIDTTFIVNAPDLGSYGCAGTYEGLHNNSFFNFVSAGISVNDDSIADMLSFSEETPSSLKILHGKGDGSFEEKTAAVGLDSLAKYNWVIPGDFNRDGLTDLAAISKDGDGVISIAYAMQDGTFATVSTATTGTTGPITDSRTTRRLEMVDLDGDGLSELFTFLPSTGAGSVWRQNSQTPDRVTAITDGLGSTVNVTYASLTDAAVYEKDTTAPTGQLNIELSIPVVRKVETTDGIGGTWSKLYRYGGLRSDTAGRGFLGFRWIEELQEDKNVKTLTEYAQAWPYTGMVTSQTVTVPLTAGAEPTRIIRQVVNTNACLHTTDGADCVVGAGKIYFPYVSRTIETTWELDTSVDPVSTLKTYFVYDRFGNQTVVTAQTITTVPAGTYTKKTTNAYLNIDTGLRWIIGRVTSSAVTSTVPNVAP